jgi:hypothetical protein
VLVVFSVRKFGVLFCECYIQEDKLCPTASSDLLTDNWGVVSTNKVLFSSLCECVCVSEICIIKIYVGNVLC